ncbi:MAG TPA: hypothetical protein P5562_01230 [Candidatus Woesebacteria bacterium]|nr:hypothetical protein [Candidatus Woesebacteria bacterium]
MTRILKYYVRIFSLLFPLFFLPIILDPYGTGKVWFLLTGGLIGLVLWLIDLLIRKDGLVKVNRYLWLGLIFLIWVFIGWWRLPLGARMASFMSPLGLGMWLSLMIWLFLWIQIADRDEFKIQVNWMAITGVILAVLSLITFLIPNSKLPINWPNKDNPLISIGQGWSLTGSLYGEVVFFLILGIEYLRRLLDKLKKKEKYILEAVLTGILGLALFLGIFKIITFGWVSLDWRSSWVIAVETLKGGVVKNSALFGVGPGNFGTAFSLFRPASYNLTKYWANAFGLSSMGLLHLWTELGIIGFLLALWGVFSLVRKWRTRTSWPVLLVVILTIFLPLNLVVLFILFWLLAYKSGEIKEIKMVLNVGESGFNILPYLVSLTLMVGIVFGIYWQIKVLAADYTMRQSLLAAAKNDGTGTYNLQIKAIALNPYVTSYHRLYSQTNLAIAAGMLQNKDLSDDDKQKASQLIQQAVDQGKAAITLNGLESANWLNLAVIYKQLIGVVDGTADWSFQAYQQAVILDPVNPLTRLDMGGLLFAAGRYDEAGRVFEQVVRDKPDFANGWYNLAYADKAQNKLAVAIADLQQAINLVPAGSGDYEKASQELEVWKKELEATTKKQGEEKSKEPETLIAPEPLPTVSEEEKVEVPVDQIQPPEITPMPTATEEPDETPVIPQE